jgi:hypothetical protein
LAYQRLTLQESATGWAPGFIKELQQPNADTTILFLSPGGVQFREPVDDGWYRASIPTNTSFLGMSGFYMADQASSPIGCSLQHQYCLSNNNNCGPLDKHQNAIYGLLDHLGISPLDISKNLSSVIDPTASRLLWLLASSGSSVDGLFHSAGSKALLSRQNLIGGIQQKLATGQWMLDIKHLWTSSLAVQQFLRVDIARGDYGKELLGSVDLPNNYQKEMCHQVCLLESTIAHLAGLC